MTPGERYCNALLVRVCGPDNITVGMLVDPDTQRVVFAAPLLRHLIGQHRDQVRRYLARIGWKATIVPRARALDIDQVHRERLERLRLADAEALEAVSAPPPVALKEKPRRPRGWPRLA